MMRILLVCVLLVLALCVGCAMLERFGITPERGEAAADYVQEVAEKVPGTPGDILEVTSWLFGIFFAGWTAWERTKGNRYKKAAVATFRGVDKAEPGMPEDALGNLKGALFKEQSKAGVVGIVAKLRANGA